MEVEVESTDVVKSKDVVESMNVESTDVVKSTDVVESTEGCRVYRRRVYKRCRVHRREWFVWRDVEPAEHERFVVARVEPGGVARGRLMT